MPSMSGIGLSWWKGGAQSENSIGGGNGWSTVVWDTVSGEQGMCETQRDGGRHVGIMSVDHVCR